jgi:superfamily II DNA or RNA helicase
MEKYAKRKSSSSSSFDEDTPLVRIPKTKKKIKSPSRSPSKSSSSGGFLDIEEQVLSTGQRRKSKSPPRKVVDYTKSFVLEKQKKAQSSINVKSPVKSKKEEKRISPPKKTQKEITFTEDDCEKFILASSKVGVKEKFLNPITKKEITKGSAAYNKYIKDCQGRLTVETKESIKKEKEEEISKFGQRKPYRCEDYKIRSSGKFEPNPHQIKARNRFLEILKNPKDPQRGLLLYYGLGSGKTCTYAMIADLYHQMYPERPIFVFTPGSLRTNFLEQYCSFCGLNPNTVSKKFAFYSINDTSIMKRLPKKLPPSLVIVDEVHKLTHGKSNDSPVISFIYDAINNSDGINIVSGSGTPIETTLDELFYLTNFHIKDKFDMLPDFKKMFKWKEGIFYPKDQEEFTKTFSPFISYYDPEKRLESTNKKAFPTVYYKNVYVPINPDREIAYIEAVKNENENMQKPNEDMKFRDYEKYKKQKQRYFIAMSRLRSAQDSNFSYPVILGKKRASGKQEATDGDVPPAMEEGGLIDEIDPSEYGENTPMALGIPDKLKEEGGWITEDILEMLYDNGEKIEQIIKDIEEHEGKHAIYTRFKTYFGSRLLGAILDLKEIPYVYFDGDMDDKSRVEVLERFNSPTNINGDKIKVIILTSAGSAGINLKEIRRFHILEQYFNLSYMKQVIGRGNRYLSHQRLPENKRNLTVLNYFLELSDKDMTKNFSSDVLSYESAKDKDRTISKVRELIQTFDI